MGRPKQNEEAGTARLNLIMTLLFLGATIFVAVKIIPPYFTNYQFQDAVESEARFALAGYPRKSEDDIRQDIYDKAQKLDLPIKKKEEITVTMNQGSVSISLDYSIPIDLLVYQFSLQFHPHADNHTI
jgi:hypothetical protein